MSVEYTLSQDGAWYEQKRMRVRFTLQANGESYRCGITQKAINDSLQTEDSQEQAMKNFDEYQGDVIALAVRLIESDTVREDGVYCVLSDMCDGYLIPRQ